MFEMPLDNFALPIKTKRTQTINYLISKKMKQIHSLTILLAAAGFVLSSCNREEVPSYASTPIESISVTSGDETTAGVVDDAAKTVTFTFNNAENFSSCDIDIKVNDGWALTFPKTLTGVDLQSTPTLNFTDPDKAIVKYSVKFSSNAFPIVDGSKIQIKGLNAGEALTVDNTTKTITIKFSESTMDFNNIELIFNDGALQTGVTLPEDLTFDFAEGNVQPIVFNLNGERVYNVVLDVTNYMKATPEQMGFGDISSQFVNADQDYIKVYAATQIAGMPLPVVSAQYDAALSYAPTWGMDLYGVSNPRPWEIISADGNHNDVTYADDLFSFPGDWKDDRTTMNNFGDIVIVTVDASKVVADIIGSSDSVDPTAQNAAIATTGWTKQKATDYLVKDNGTVVNAGIEGIPYRASITIADGTIGFATAAQKDGAFYNIPFQAEDIYEYTGEEDDKTAAVQAIAQSASEEIVSEDLAWVAGWLVRKGTSMKIHDLINNDGTIFVSDGGVLGMGWGSNFYCVHNLVGTTYDGKIAFMINRAGVSNWDGAADYVSVDNGVQTFTEAGFNYRGYSLKQMAWLAQRLGWREAAVLGNSFEEAKDFTPSLLVNGKSVIDGVTPSHATYVLTLNAK